MDTRSVPGETGGALPDHPPRRNRPDCFDMAATVRGDLIVHVGRAAGMVGDDA